MWVHVCAFSFAAKNMTLLRFEKVSAVGLVETATFDCHCHIPNTNSELGHMKRFFELSKY